MNKQFNLDAKTIYEKEFPIDFKGYSPSEVDHFLDFVIQDYQSYELCLSQMAQKCEELERANASLKAKLIEFEGKVKVLNDDNANVSSTDILKRLARLEAAVFNQD